MQKKLFEQFAAANKEDWTKEILKNLKGQNLDTLNSLSYEGIEIRPFYTQEDLNQPLFVPHSKTNHWKNREKIFVKKISEANLMAKEALSKGADSLDFVLRDTENLDINALLQGVDLAQFEIGFTLGGDISDFLQQTQTLGFQGFVQYDFLAEWTISGNLSENTWGNLTKIITQFNSQPIRTLGINTAHLHNAGANAVQELAFGMALAVEYLDKLTEKGLNISDLLPRIEFSFALGGNYFMEIAKLRAFRVLWHQVSNAFINKENSLVENPIRLHTETSHWNKSILDSYNNLLRLTTEAMSGVLGNSDSLTVLPYNDFFAEPEEFSRRISRNISTILKEESYLDRVADVSAGAYYLESLTQSLVEQSWGLFQEIEQNGGFIKAFEQNLIQNAIEKTALLRKESFQNKKDVLVGVNKYQNTKEKINIPASNAKPQNTVLKLLNLERLASNSEVMDNG